VADAVGAGGPIVVCLFDERSVHDVLDPVVPALAGRTVINLTTTTPAESRALSSWATEHRISFLDGAILAVPEMIGQPGSTIFYSGDTGVFTEHRDLLDTWGESLLLGDDPGRAALYDMAMLSGMYTMFAGFLHGAAMLAADGIPATEFARMQAPFLAAMTNGLHEYAATADSGTYDAPGQQSLHFTETALAALLRAAAEQGISTELLQPLHHVVARQIATGHGNEGTARIFEELRRQP
jgi:3-hydroxyisobutyrate dehydrogenase-like beta-hydroxyacid dehydrogenase